MILFLFLNYPYLGIPIENFRAMFVQQFTELLPDDVCRDISDVGPFPYKILRISKITSFACYNKHPDAGGL